MLKDPGTPDPQLVADAIADLVDAPAGQRPLRTVVGFDVGAAEVNAAAAPHASAALERSGLGLLATIWEAPDPVAGASAA